MTSEAEQKDLDTAKARARQILDSTFAMSKEYARMDATSLSHCGRLIRPGEGLEDVQNRAIAFTVRQALKNIANIWKDHFKEWPD